MPEAEAAADASAPEPKKTMQPRLPRLPRCAFFSKSLAKSTFLLSDRQLDEMPQINLSGQAAKRTGPCLARNRLQLSRKT